MSKCHQKLVNSLASVSYHTSNKISLTSVSNGTSNKI